MKYVREAPKAWQQISIQPGIPNFTAATACGKSDDPNIMALCSRNLYVGITDDIYRRARSGVKSRSKPGGVRND